MYEKKIENVQCKLSVYGDSVLHLAETERMLEVCSDVRLGHACCAASVSGVLYKLSILSVWLGQLLAPLHSFSLASPHQDSAILQPLSYQLLL